MELFYHDSITQPDYFKQSKGTNCPLLCSGWCSENYLSGIASTKKPYLRLYYHHYHIQ
jgi:hypothetical protein